ncbi:Hypothetical protein CINCED_3A011851 [Cinara cedri]|uniref:Uncharacterized protein n=1 Tax=Cinara cedri TaxID=506608 RepID=A0A5E4NPZ5_9HEMI|nr:Hypothetical protein CINCED_3A011851 [Cinara cedri]
MTYINNTNNMLVDEVVAGNNMSNKHKSKIQDKKIWKSLRTHIMSRREKNKQAEVNAEILRKKKCVEYQKMQENKLSLAQINGRLSQLQDKRVELEEEKRALLDQTQADEMVTSLVMPKIELKCELGTNKLMMTNNLNNTIISNHRSHNLTYQQIFRQQNSMNVQSGMEGLSGASGGLSPCAPKSYMMQSPNTICYNNGYSNQTLMVCSPSTVNAANIQNNVARSMPLGANLSNTMALTKFPSMNSNSTLSAVSPDLLSSIKQNRSPSPQQMNNNSSNNPNTSTTSTALINNINQTLFTTANNNYHVENSNRHGRQDTSQTIGRNMWINNSNKNAQSNVGNYGPYYQTSSTASINYCVNNGMPSSSSLSSVNTVYSYSGPPPLPISRTETCNTSNTGNLIASSSGEHAIQQISQSVNSQHQTHYLTPSHPPMYMSPTIRNQTPNHAYEKLVSPGPNYYQHPGNRNVHLSNTMAGLPHTYQMQSQKSHISYPIRHPTVPPPILQHMPGIIQSSQHGSYNNVPCSITGYLNKSPASAASTGDIPRYQIPSQTPMSRHE